MAEYTPIGQGTYNTVAGSVGLASALFVSLLCRRRKNARQK